MKNPPCAQWKCTSGGWELYDLPAGASCSDGNTCTRNDTCDAYGTCIGTGTPGASCNDADRLTYEDACVLNDTSSALVCKGRPLPFHVKVLDSLTKLEQHADFLSDPNAISARLTAARNEFEAFQLAIRPRSVSSPMTIAVSPLRASGTTVTIDMDVYREKFFDTSAFLSSHDAVAGSWPDWLVPGTTQTDGSRATTHEPVTGINEVAYVEAFVPEGAPATTYSGEVAVKWTEGGAEKQTSFLVQLTVQPFTLPQTSTLRSYYRVLSPYAACSAYGNELDRSRGCSDLVLQFAQMGLEHRIAVDPIRATSAPITSDFRETYEDFFDGRSRKIHYPTAKLVNAKPTTAGAYPDVDATFLPQWYAIYNDPSLNWLDRSFYYVCDEPQNDGTSCPKVNGSAWPTVEERARASYLVSPQIHRLVTTYQEAAAAGLAKLGSSYVDLIDYMAPNVLHVQPEGQRSFPSDLETSYADYRRTGGWRQLWWYQACDAGGCAFNDRPLTRSGYPQLAIDVRAVMNRSMPWMTYRFGMAAELYWDVTYAFSRDAADHLDLARFTQFRTWGDGTLFYPGPTGPHPSLRLKLIRDGMEDYEYLKLIADPACALNIANDLYPHALAAAGGGDAGGAGADKDAAALLLHRKQAADKILNPTSACPYCAPGLNYCGSVCRDLANDPNNCGWCGHVCSSGTCDQSKCTIPTCAPGYTDCSGTCVLLSSDRANCGACGNTCDGLCRSGACTPYQDCLPGTVCP